MAILSFKEIECMDCYKCVRHCPVKSITVKNGRAQILESECILCGTCTVVCPQNAKEDSNDIPKILELLSQGRQIVATVAPSWITAYPKASFQTFSDALAELGFSYVSETAEGAYVVKSHYEKLVEDKWNDVIISSCCTTINLYIEHHFPEALDFLAPIISPMQVSARKLKDLYPNAIVIFIGPCISKKAECGENGADYVITFDELEGWFENSSIEPKEDGSIPTPKLSRSFPYSGGILDSMLKNRSFQYIAIDGIENCINALQEIVSGNLKGYFIEMSACTGSCIGGPSFQKSQNKQIFGKTLVRKQAVNESGKNIDFETRTDFSLKQKFLDKKIVCMPPTEWQLAAILKKMGKNTVEDELNCGSCGYPSCREKAVAIYENKADINMCLPFMKARTQSFADKVIEVSPNLILAVDIDMCVIMINNATCKAFHLSSPEDILGSPVSRILDEYNFIDLIASGEERISRNIYVAEYGLYLEQTLIYDKGNSIISCIMKDITQLRMEKNRIRQAKMDSANMADEIVEAQLRTVHEIASLLGETAAKTKLAIMDLKKTILMDDEIF
ncbi:4Fe-4S binding protein [Tissierella carlieri]|mgnify:CR=1 FL=1|uniref:4Fe-4S binding protein n=1 Tax=Tissierella carlieri TaxID=689904 RepID=A0ABT1S809_9FIRM|nr:[Fe-Fe] hydrogenase large subunit C-terminal domain-containing protein [Tissierella carlieri]MBU5311974.1 4Fe-4S binding protein [Tissierella carlieri]MCQ4922602.1 4Fe-4S binding protein [Tissierella carlieri]